MKRERRNLFQRSASLMLAVVMVLSVIVVMPKDVKAAADRVLPAGGGTIAITDQECAAAIRDYNWISYTAAKDGYLKLTFSNNTKLPSVGYSDGSVTLYDAAKATPLSSTTSYNTEETRAFMISEYYGVKKGTTYKIRVNSYGGVIINAQFKAINKKLNNNLKKKKAVTLKKKKQTDGIIQPGNLKSHFYKFKVPKSKKIKISITPYLTSDCYLFVSGPNLKRSRKQIFARSVSNGYVYVNSWGSKNTYTISSPITGKASAGTYYMEVKPIGRTCSGYYKISWQ